MAGPRADMIVRGTQMTRVAAIILLLIGSSLASGQEPERTAVVPRNPSHAVFYAIADRWLAGYNGTDAGALAALYTEDAQYISGHVPGLVASGRSQVVGNFQKGMSAGGHLDRLEVISVNQSGDLATVLCRYDANNSGQKVSGRTLLVLRRAGGGWLIALHMTVV